MTLLNPPNGPTGEPLDNIPPSFLAQILDRLIQDPPRNWNDETKANLFYAIRLRYQKLGSPIPTEVGAVMQLVDILGSQSALVRLVQRQGPKATSSLDACKEMLAAVEARDISYQQVANALLFMVIAENGQAYDPATFISALREHRAGQRLDWQDVIQSFDREGLRITKQQFLILFNAFLPLAHDYENFDIQSLWGNVWEHKEAKLSFVVAFLSCTPDELDATNIPRLRKAFTQDMYSDAPEDAKQYVKEALRYPLVSLDATVALFNMIFRSQDTYAQAQSMGIPETVINANTDIFLVSASAVPKPWGGLQDQAMKQLFQPYFEKTLPNYNFVLHGLWKHDNVWLATRLLDSYLDNPMCLVIILEHAQQHGWLDALISMNKEMSVDLAALAHSKGIFDLGPWAQQHLQLVPAAFTRVLSNFLASKAEVDLQVQRDHKQPETVPLAVKTVHPLLVFLQGHLPDDDLVQLQRTCIQAYPRLINYGEGFDKIIDEAGKGSNAIPEEADAKMQEHYKKMYSGESDVRDIVEALQRYKTSEDPTDQDLFACMIHGLFDEYNCFGEYPLEALATTAVLFGSIINYNLLSRIALQAGLAMVLEAVQEFGPDESMYKFGRQALLNFSSRLQEWPTFCDRLLRVPGLQGTEIWSKAEEIVSRQPAETNGNPKVLTNGDSHAFPEPDSSVPNFSCLSVDPPLQPDMYVEPAEEIQDRVLFVLNNISERNLEVKLRDLQEALEDKYRQWFATYLVDERAKLQPNFQQLYLDMLGMLNDRLLWAEVLRETYVSVIGMLNADSSMSSSVERTHLKNLGGWLGSLTIARDKPIKFRNISFKDLLVEGHDTQRLLLVIPFTCKVLLQAAKSTVFKPPNPWLMEILQVLIELYHFAEIKLNLKFEIEVLCKGLELDYKSIEPADIIRSRPMAAGDFIGAAGLPDGLEGFNELSLMSLNRGRPPTERFSPAVVTAGLPDIGSLLMYPPLNSAGGQNRIRQVFLSAAQQAVADTIAPVVERSVTIASISASQLIAKDFALEADETKIREAAHNVVKSLSGSLALVTCKEPLRMAVTNNIRLIARDLPEQALPEGSILMFVNDNIDALCGMVEQAAENHSASEIDNQIEELLRMRRIHRATRPNEPFMDPMLSRWAFYIPEPYRQGPGGLNKEQMAIYEEFGRQARGTSNHTNTASQDSGRQVPDVLQEQFSNVPGLSANVHNQASQRQATTQQQQQQQQQQQMMARGTPGMTGAPQMNGYVETQSIAERIQDMLAELQRATKEAPEEHIKDLSPNSSVRDIYEQIIHAIESSGSQSDGIAFHTARKITSFIYSDAERQLEAEVMTQLLTNICQFSVQTARQVILWLSNFDGERIFNAMVTVCLINAGLLNLSRVDSFVAKAIQQRKVIAVEFLSELLDSTLLADDSNALRADFAKSFEALTHWLVEAPDFDGARRIITKLQAPEPTEGIGSPQSPAKQDQMEYIFEEWIHLQENDAPERTIAAFVHQLHQKHLLDSQVESAIFFRLCVDISVANYEREENTLYGSLDVAYIHVDAFAKLIVCLVLHQDEQGDSTVEAKAAYFEAILSLVVLVLCHHHQTRGERFNQKIFFRLFSSIICEVHEVRAAIASAYKPLILILGKATMALQPKYFSGFAFSWLAIISHRLLMPALLKMETDSVGCFRGIEAGTLADDPEKQGWEMYVQIMETLLAYAGELVKPVEVSPLAKDFYRGVLRVLLVLHHDFPEFLAENHFRLCCSIPAHCTQLRNLVVSAFPSSFPELPDPFSSGLKVDRLEEMRKAPNIRSDLEAPLIKAGVKNVVDSILQKGDFSDANINSLCEAVYHPQRLETTFGFAPVTIDTILLHALVLYIGSAAINSAGTKGQTFIVSSHHTRLFERFARDLRPEARYHFISTLVNQLRYPNSHTHYFSYALLHLFGCSYDKASTAVDVQQQMTRVLLERLHVHRPHPWGLIITLLEILKNPTYQFWDLPFVKAAPEVC